MSAASPLRVPQSSRCSEMTVADSLLTHSMPGAPGILCHPTRQLLGSVLSSARENWASVKFGGVTSPGPARDRDGIRVQAHLKPEHGVQAPVGELGGLNGAWLIAPAFAQVTIGMFLLSGDPCFKT